MAKYVVKFPDGSYSDTSGWHPPVTDIDNAKVFQTKSAASKRANEGARRNADGTWISPHGRRVQGKAIRVKLTEIEE